MSLINTAKYFYFQNKQNYFKSPLLSVTLIKAIYNYFTKISF